MKILLIPTDFSTASQQALQYGISFLQDRKEKGKILLLNTYLLPTAPADRLVALHDELRNRSTQKLKEQIRLAQQAIPDHQISFETLSRMGSFENVIAHLTQEQKVEGVVLGLNGTSKEKEKITKVLDRIHCPLIVVPFEQINPDKNHIAS